MTPRGRWAALAWWIAACAGAPTGSGVEAPVNEGFILGEVIPCEAPLPEPRYVERGEAMGLLPAEDPDNPHGPGGGLAVEDLDGDGDLDLVVTRWYEEPMVYWREGEGFVPERLGGATSSGQTLGLADLDGDGRRDLIVTAYASHPGIYLNRGGAFEAMTLEDNPYADARGSQLVDLTPGDIDGDGRIDLLGVTSGSLSDPSNLADRLLTGRGDGRFDAPEQPLDPSASERPGFDGVLLDVEGDGDLDAYVVNDLGWRTGPNVLWRNDEGALVDGSGGCDCAVVMEGMGADVDDLDDDGDPDLYLTGVGANVLLENQGGRFVDVTSARAAVGVDEAPSMAWGASFLDYDNDGRKDLLVAMGDIWTNPADSDAVFEQPLRLLRQGDDGAFEDVSASLGLPTTGSWRAALGAELNGDGVLDLVVTGIVDRPLLYLSEGCTAASWIEVEAPAYAKVTVEADGRTAVGFNTPDSGYGGAGPLIVHLGLGEAEAVQRVVVEAVDGERWRLTEEISPRRRLRLER